MKKFFIISIILGIILTPCSFNFPEFNNLQAQTEIYYSETISQNTTWTASSSPYVIYGDSHLRILPGVVLTIEPGVIVKFSENGGLGVNGGEIIAKGTKENPIIFTSNHGSSYPQSGGWSSIEVYNHGKITFDYAVVEYGGFIQSYERLDNKIFKLNTALAQDYYYDNFTGAITISGAQADINNSIIASSTIGLKILDVGDPDYHGYPDYATSTVSIHNSKIYNNDRYGIFNYGSSRVDATYNWWGDDSGPEHPNNPEGQGEIITGDILFDPWIGKEKKKDPVIIVPGIMGSWNVSGKWELDPILHTYDNLWEALKSAGYEENKTLFAFPYQWRLSNSYTAILLKDKIQEVKNICQCDQVDLVTHSMGGLAAKAYIQSNDYQNDVDQLIFLGTPHKGSTKAYLAWEGGEFGPKIKDKIQQRIFAVEADFNGYGSVFKYVRGLPMQSVQELLPIYDYLRDKDTMQLRAYPNNYPVNTFLELLNNQSQLEKLNSINITNILADAGSDSTINNLRVVEKEFIDGEWEHGYPEHYSLPFTDHG
ncbi:alpha/beta hydrolase, partial [Patescibacteria group bacterium]|nr:alpha/beta hydrolase [Patescibacteria group bacterium]